MRIWPKRRTPDGDDADAGQRDADAALAKSCEDLVKVERQTDEILSVVRTSDRARRKNNFAALIQDALGGTAK